MRIFVCVLLAVLVSAIALLVIIGDGEAIEVPAPETIRATEYGEVVGLVADNGAHVWRGIPFAASTAGQNRWRAPRPPARWRGVKEALSFADRCAQLTNELDGDEGLEPGLVIGSENCLALDIYAPADARQRALPVMVWIHGGGNVWGRSSAYDGSRLAVNEDVIVVAVQYRLGPLGWFAHPALRASAVTPEDAAASFASLDLIAALRWLQGNIAGFGGAPDQVTVFGVSAGGHNVATLLASPLASGLFHRAIIQSGSFDSLSVAEAQGDVGSAANPSLQIADRLGAATAEQLRAVELDQLFAAYERGRGFLDVPRVIEDGVVLPAHRLREAFLRAETFHAVPIITGTNRDEMKLFYASSPDLVSKSLGVLPVPRDQPYFDALTGYLSRLWRLRSVDEPAAAMVAAGHEAVYAYRFDWDDGGRLLTMDFKTLFGAAHGFEVPFVFNLFRHLGDADRFLFARSTAVDREELSRAMGGYWAAFARDGAPASAAGPAWPKYGAGGGSFLRFDSAADGGIEVLEGAESFESILSDLRHDPRLSDAQRCAIVGEMGQWMFTRPLLARAQAALACE